jgi:hypothetical protein
MYFTVTQPEKQWQIYAGLEVKLVVVWVVKIA